MRVNAADPLIVRTAPQGRVVRSVRDHNNLGFTTLTLSWFRRGGPSGEVSDIDIQEVPIEEVIRRIFAR